MFILLLLLGSPERGDAITRAWVDLGIQGIYALESTSCREAAVPPARAPAGLQVLAGLFGDGSACHVLYMAAAETLAQAEQAAAAVEQVAGPWRTSRARLYALPVEASWGTERGEEQAGAGRHA